MNNEERQELIKIALEEGETITSLYSDALEISQEKFINEWKECFKNLS